MPYMAPLQHQILASKHRAMLQRIYRWLAFSHVTAPALPEGPALVLAAHYNGILDGIVYLQGNATLIPVLSSQWHRSALGRWLIPGLALTRAKDGANASGNLATFKAMLHALQAGGRLLFFPEGTSRLGRERLPVQRGAELLLRQIRSKAPDVPIYFAAANYENPTRWRSRVAVAIDGPHRIPDDKTDLNEWVAQGLLRGQDRAYAHTFVPRNPGLQRLRRLVAFVALWPAWPAAMASRWAIVRKADDTNVISLWRILGGVPAALLSLALLTTAAMVGGWGWIAPAAVASTLIGVTLWQS